MPSMSRVKFLAEYRGFKKGEIAFLPDRVVETFDQKKIKINPEEPRPTKKSSAKKGAKAQ